MNWKKHYEFFLDIQPVDNLETAESFVRICSRGDCTCWLSASYQIAHLPCYHRSVSYSSLIFFFFTFFISELLFLAKLCTCDIHIYVHVRYNFNTISCDSLIQFQSNLDTAYINVENRCRFGFEFDRYRADFYEL